MRNVFRPSKFVPDTTYEESLFHCPSCETPIPIEHGDRILCGCGLYMENYGNSLVLWRDASQQDQLPRSNKGGQLLLGSPRTSTTEHRPND